MRHGLLLNMLATPRSQKERARIRDSYTTSTTAKTPRDERQAPAPDLTRREPGKGAA